MRACSFVYVKVSVQVVYAAILCMLKLRMRIRNSSTHGNVSECTELTLFIFFMQSAT